MTVPQGMDAEGLAYWQQFRRQALHAWRLKLYHPENEELMSWESPLPEDMETLLDLLRQVRRAR